MVWIQLHWAELLHALLAFLGFFSIIAKLKPTQVDDKLLAKIISVIHFFGLSRK